MESSSTGFPVWGPRGGQSWENHAMPPFACASEMLETQEYGSTVPINPLSTQDKIIRAASPRFDCTGKKSSGGLSHGGKVLRQCRREHRLSEQQIADLLDCSQFQVSRMERGQNTISQSQATILASRFGISRENFLVRSPASQVSITSTSTRASVGDSATAPASALFASRMMDSFIDDKGSHGEALYGGALLKRLRNNRKLAQRAIAKVLGWSQNSISKMELGGKRITEFHAAKLADYFKIDASRFLADPSTSQASITPMQSASDFVPPPAGDGVLTQTSEDLLLGNFIGGIGVRPTMGYEVDLTNAAREVSRSFCD